MCWPGVVACDFNEDYSCNTTVALLLFSPKYFLFKWRSLFSFTWTVQRLCFILKELMLQVNHQFILDIFKGLNWFLTCYFWFKHSQFFQTSYWLNIIQLEWAISTDFHSVWALQGLHQKKAKLTLLDWSLLFSVVQVEADSRWETSEDSQRVSAHLVARLLLKWNWCLINNFKVTNISITISNIHLAEVSFISACVSSEMA